MSSTRLRGAPLLLLVALLIALTPVPVSSPAPEAVSPVASAGRGNPHVNFLDGDFLHAEFTGDDQLGRVIRSGLARPSGIALADFDGDGVKDLVTAYVMRDGGIIGIRRGNIDSRHPNGPHVQKRKADGTFFEEPFAKSERLQWVAVKPRFIAAGDISGDGHADIVFGSDAESEVVWLPGHGDGAFATGRTVDVRGPVSLLVMADANRPDGRLDLVVGTADTAGPELLVFEGPDGSIHAEPERFSMESPPTAVVVDRLDDKPSNDIAVAAGHNLVIISGRDRKLSLDLKQQESVAPAHVRSERFASPIRSMAASQFINHRLRDLAIVLDNGSLGIRDAATGDILHLPYTFDAAIKLASAKVAALPGRDLLVLERNALHILHNDHFETASAGIRAEGDRFMAPLSPVTFELGFEATDMFATRLNWDAPDDIAIAGVGSDGSALAVVNSAPVKTFTVNDSGDDGDRFDDGECLTQAGVCTFRAASQEASRSAGPHAIQFAVGTVVAGVQGFGLNQLTTVDGESFGSRVAFEGNALLTFNADGCLVKGISAATIIGGDSFTAVNVFASVEPDGITAMNGSGLVAGGVLSTLGGTNEAERNVTAAMALNDGSNEVYGNYVGLRADGAGALDNAQVRQYGFRVESDANVIGGMEPGAANFIAGFPGSGSGSSAVRLAGGSNRFQGNYVGTDAAGKAPVPNGGQGLGIYAGNPDPAFEGPTSVLDNVIAASGQEGIVVGTISGLLIQGNFVGTDRSSVVVMGGETDGIWIASDSAVAIGGSALAARNVIVNNGASGIEMSFGRAESDPHLIQGNFIGITPFGTPMPNADHGILLRNQGGSLIGGADPNEGNEIAHNGLHGIRFSGVGTKPQEIVGNSIHTNGLLGISFGRRGDLPELNDAGDSDDGPNGEQNYPALTHMGNGSVEVSLNSRPNARYSVEYFGNPECDPSGNGEGQYFLGFDELTTDGAGDATLTRMISAFEGRQFIAATATDSVGNTSEFSVCVEIDPQEAILVRVLQTPLIENPGPVANTDFEVGKVNLLDARNLFDPLSTMTSDAEGILTLDPAFFAIGDAFYVKAKATEKTALTPAHGPVDGLSYEIFVDNLVINNDGHFEAYHLEPGITDTYLAHPYVSYNLVVSIEWPATDQYVASLEAFFRSASNYLYDVTDGQALLNKIAIYDNRRHFFDADLKLYVNNQQWPMARPGGINYADGFIHYPPQHFGLTPAQNADFGFTVFPPDLDAYDGYAPFIHEFGHYAFGLYDEYLTDVGGGRLRSLQGSVNHGFMDDPLRLNDPNPGPAARSTEMSAWILDGYEETLHFQRRSKPTAETFRDFFSGAFGPVQVEIRTPMNRGMTAPDLVVGPNDDPDNLDYDVGAQMTFVRDVSSSSTPPIEYLVLGSDGQPLPGVFVEIERSDHRTLLQGRAVTGLTPGSEDHIGKIRLRGASDGDDVLFSHPTVRNGLPVPGEWDFLETPVSTAGKVDLITVQMNQVDGTFDLLPVIGFEPNGSLSYSAEASNAFPALPELEVVIFDEPPQSFELALDGPAYRTDLPELGAQASLRFRAVDESDSPFFVPQTAHVLDIVAGADENAITASSAELFFGPEPGIERAALLESEFPAPTAGLPDSTLRASPVYAVSTYPTGTDYKAQMWINYDGEGRLAADTSAVTIYRWDGDAWEPVETGVVTRYGIQLTMTVVEVDGFYAAYLDLTKATGVANEFEELPAEGPPLDRALNFPNPFRDVTSIPLDVERPVEVSIRVYNLLGQLVDYRDLGILQTGRRDLQFDGEGLPSGTYPYVVRVGDTTLRGWMTIAR